jgi:hypothetical protein
MSTYSPVYSLTPIHIYSGSAFVVIPGVTDVGGPKLSKATIDVTTMNSVNYKDFVAAPLADPGTLDFSINFAPSDPVHKFIAKRASTLSTGSAMYDIFQMKFNDGTNYEFSGSFTKFDVKAGKPESTVLQADLSVKISGKISGSF